jgi:hypothetical protein
MKKILLCAVAFGVLVTSCKKKQDNPSITVTASYPTISWVATPYFSIPLGGTLPTNVATAYDSFYKEKETVVLADNTIVNMAPGLYSATASAQNKYGFSSSATYYVAVTGVSSALNLAGTWTSPANDSIYTSVTSLANGFYLSNNVTGVNMINNSANAVSGLFVVTSDTSIVFDANTAASYTSGSGALVLTIHVAGDTTMTYGLLSSGTNITFGK